MLRKVLNAKIHHATVTETHVDYVGSITIDATLLRATGIHPNESVLIADMENGNRFETYVFRGEPDTGIIAVNGAAAKLVGPGHRLIIMNFGYIESSQLDDHAAKVVVVDEQNRIAQQLDYPSSLELPVMAHGR